MNRENIIKLAKESGFYIKDNEIYSMSTQSDHELTEWIERFASLVAQQEREKIAQMIEDAPELMDFAKNDKGGCLMCGFTPEIAAQYIREK